MENSKFMKYTVGLECNGHGQVAKLVKVAYYRNTDGSVTLRAENGRNGASLPGEKTVQSDKFDGRPSGDVESARWALNLCGWSLMSDDFAEANVR